jgi:hypothetical protein
VSRGAGGTIFQPLALQPCARGGACWSMVAGWLAACASAPKASHPPPQAPPRQMRRRERAMCAGLVLVPAMMGRRTTQYQYQRGSTTQGTMLLPHSCRSCRSCSSQRLLMLRFWSCYALLLAKGPVLHHIRRANVCTQLCHTVGARWCQRRAPPEACLFMSNRRLFYNA